MVYGVYGVKLNLHRVFTVIILVLVFVFPNTLIEKRYATARETATATAPTAAATVVSDDDNNNMDEDER
jgi:hypothetical protein